MKSFFSMFSSSSKELTKLSAVTTTGMLIGLAIVFKMTLSFQLTEEIRISFVFIPLTIIAMLFGPSISGISYAIVDFLGYLVANKSARQYYPPLVLSYIMAGIIYGIFLYNNSKTCKIYMIIIAKTLVTLFCNCIMTTLILYGGFINKEFSLFNIHCYNKQLLAYATPRLFSNFIQLPIQCAILIIVLPLVSTAYNRVHKTNKV